MSSYGQCSMEKLAGDLLLGLKFVKLEILSTSFIDFLYEVLGELRSRSLGLNGLTDKLAKIPTTYLFCCNLTPQCSNVKQDASLTKRWLWLNRKIQTVPLASICWHLLLWLLWSQRFSFGVKRREERERSGKRNLWLWAMRISLSCYDRCHENRLTSNQ